MGEKGDPIEDEKGPCALGGRGSRGPDKKDLNSGEMDICVSGEQVSPVADGKGTSVPGGTGGAPRAGRDSDTLGGKVSGGLDGRGSCPLEEKGGSDRVGNDVYPLDDRGSWTLADLDFCVPNRKDF